MLEEWITGVDILDGIFMENRPLSNSYFAHAHWLNSLRFQMQFSSKWV
jgi:hypothetical protein